MGNTVDTGSAAPAVADTKIEHSISPGLSQRLSQMNVSLAFTSYQSGLLYLVGTTPNGGVNIHQTALPKPMGLCTNAQGSLVVSCDSQILHFENALAPEERINDVFDACFIPREVRITGRLDVHDVGLEKDVAWSL